MINEIELKTKLLENKSKKQIAIELNTSNVTLLKYIRKYNLEEFYSYDKSKAQQLNNKSVDINFFKVIDTEEKAYIFGLVLSDGWVAGKILGFTFQETDLDVLEKVKTSLKSNHKISYKFYDYRKPQYTLSISSKEIADDLKALGITNNKSFDAYIPFDKIDPSLIRHVMRGIFDGDGSFSQNKPCICTSSVSLRDDIINWCISNYNYSPSVSIQNNKYRVYFRKPGFKVVCDIYQDSCIYMNRKFNSFQEYYKYRIKNQ